MTLGWPDLRSRESRILLICGLLGGLLFFWCYWQISPTRQLNLATNRWEAADVAQAYLDSLGHSVEGFISQISLNIDNLQEYYFERAQLSASQRARLETIRSVATWEVTFRHPERNERYQVSVSSRGGVSQFEHVLPENLTRESLSQEDAATLVKNALSSGGIRWSEFELLDVQTLKLPGRTDYIFQWQAVDRFPGGLKLNLWGKAVGGEFGGWGRKFEYPQEVTHAFQSLEDTSDLFAISIQFLILVIFALSLIVFALRFRAGEVSVRNALLYAIVTLVLTLLHFVNTMDSLGILREAARVENRTFLLFLNYFVIVFITLWSSFTIFMVWASGESLTREIWGEKLKVFDALFSGRVFFLEAGRGILRGFSLGLLSLAITYAGYYLLAARNPDLWLLTTQSEDSFLAVTMKQALEAYVPMAYPIIAGLCQMLYAISYAVLFTLALLKRRLRSTVLAALITLLVYDTIFGGAITALNHRGLQIVLAILAGSLAYLFYLRYDLFTVSVGFMVAIALPPALTYLQQPDAYFRAAGVTSLSILFAFFGYGYVTYKRSSAVDEEEITPSYTRHISERQRLKMELEIARRAQLRMLPQSIPSLPGLDIAAFSEPALEVGGDYYDFVLLDEHTLGIVVGDVSGKGMSAALYMTLTKGFLQALAEPKRSPAEVLGRINRYFYKAADPNTFVSLFYAVLDPVNKTATFARAGHNPVIMRRNGAQGLSEVHPGGIAVGLEPGEIFDRVIQEARYPLEPGDVLVMYTDGLTEGRNGKREEFGESRLRQVIERFGNQPAYMLLAEIQKEHKRFVANQEPHDDMTCVVVKLV